jgi:hypothetical protein
MNYIASPICFVFDFDLYIKNAGRFYMLVDSNRKRSQAARKNLTAYKRISRSRFYESMEACKKMIGGGV